MKKNAWLAGMAFLLVGCEMISSKDVSYMPLVNQLFSSLDLPEASDSKNLVALASGLSLSSEDRIHGEFPIFPVQDEHLVYQNFSLLRMTQDVPAYEATYNSVVILGSALPLIRQRLAFLVGEWQRGVRFNEIIFVTGKRPLYAGAEEKEEFFGASNNPFSIEPNWDRAAHELPSSELEVAQFVWKQMALPRVWRDPSVMRVVFLEADPQDGREYSNRHDTLKLLQNYRKADSGKILFMSSQPFIHVDLCRIESYYDRENFDIAGPGFAQTVLKQEWAPSLCLSALSGWVAETNGKLRISLER